MTPSSVLTITNNFISHRLMGLGSGHSTSLRKSVINHVPCILISLIYFIILYLISLFITYIYILILFLFFYLSCIYLFVSKFHILISLLINSNFCHLFSNIEIRCWIDIDYASKMSQTFNII